ncbi:MAG: zf-TFIIB domain-containing protein [Desulfuromonadales bacterium]|nr:zf-TFIIB domain-containing protein [Desulfuromonadales bacterium]NIS40058.1 zf-TFIIB domain-containing protein [Desulfuromonadales bacterium]
MSDAWEERKKAMENEYFYREEKAKIEKMRTDTREKLIRELCSNRCPKCGQVLTQMTFREVPLDKCPDCGGVWLGPNDLQILSEKDHRTWFDRWFKEET